MYYDVIGSQTVVKSPLWSPSRTKIKKNSAASVDDSCTAGGLVQNEGVSVF